MKSKSLNKTRDRALKKRPSGIRGLDEVTNGGLPMGRTTLVTGGAGCGKTLFGLEFLFCGALKYDEPGVFVSFEETPEELVQNVASMGRDLQAAVDNGLILLEHIHIDKSEIEETGEYDLDGLFIRLEHAIDSIGAKRIVLDTLETLFSGLANALIVRAELRRLFHWLKAKGVTAILTGERGDTEVSKYSLEEFVADCVIVLDHRVNNQVTTRRLRIVKYRGSTHGTNEYPFLIDSSGISVMPVTSLNLDHMISSERVSAGIPALDRMLGNRGYFRGSSILLSGTAGTGKTTFTAKFAAAACARGERCLFFAFEESPDQILRNMRSTGTDLGPALKSGKLVIHAARPTLFGLEHHLVTMHDCIERFKPDVVIVDPMSNLISVGTPLEVKVMLTRLIDALKKGQTTTMFTSLLSSAGDVRELNEIGVSSLMDTWIMLRSTEAGGEQRRALQVVKSRGMAHSHQIREFVMSNSGVEIRGADVGEEAHAKESEEKQKKGRRKAR